MELTRSQQMCIGYTNIKKKYQKLIYAAKNKYNWDTSRFMNLIAKLFERKDKEVERHINSFKEV